MKKLSRRREWRDYVDLEGYPARVPEGHRGLFETMRRIRCAGCGKLMKAEVDSQGRLFIKEDHEFILNPYSPQETGGFILLCGKCYNKYVKRGGIAPRFT